ncbi:hypothetical protein ACMGDK_11425 [Chryseobacterium sp. DT-3]|uniref:hypothetical protein n=1 Tax=Chryseobacterium sp. DT-3 TaxID=3396164 RepID=UPI003F1C953C
MAKTQNIFVNSKMDSDTSYSMLDNKSYVTAKNLRITGKGDDGAFKFLKGMDLVSSEFSEPGMIILGAKEGYNNKNYFLLAHSNGKSKVIEYDSVTNISRLIIQDTTILRFDLVRWNLGAVIVPYKFILSIDLIGDLLFISNENWEYPRVINITRDYSTGFISDDIILAKKPPKSSPEIISLVDNGYKNNDNDVFISFTYRYKYIDGDYSSLSFYSDTTFEPMNSFKMNSQRENTAMVNKWDTVKLQINSGGKYVTDIEVYAREHTSNTAYLIYAVNKNSSNINDDVLISDIEYKFSKNYEVLDEETTKMLYSNIPKHPKTQTVAGNRIIFANYKEGYDISDLNGNPIQVDFQVLKTQDVYSTTAKRKTATSMFKYKVAVIYINDYNESSTALLPVNQLKSEVEISFSDRLKANHLQVEMLSPPPAWATKMKFAVKSETLNYEILYMTYAKKIGANVYFLLTADNVNRIKKGDYIFRVDTGAIEYKEFIVEDVKEYNVNQGLNVTGTYARIKDESGYMNFTVNGPDIIRSHDKNWAVFDSLYGTNNPARFDATSGWTGTWDGNFYTSYENRGTIFISDYGAIKEGDVFTYSVNLTYGRDKKGRGESAISVSGTVVVAETIYAEQDYPNILEFLQSSMISPFIKLQVVGNEIRFLTNNLYPDLVHSNGGWIYDWQSNSGNRDERGVVKVKTNTRLERGIKPIIFRTKNKENLEALYYETEKTYMITNGIVFPDSWNGSNPIFDINFYNGYTWENGIESYKIKDSFNQKFLDYKFRGTLYEKNGYRMIHRKNDITYSGLYNYEFRLNNLSVFNPVLSNWKSLPIKYGSIQRIVSTDGDITVFCVDKVINQYYGKSIIMDMQGIESVGISSEVLGNYRELPYEFGISENPESIAKFSNYIFFTDKKRKRILLKAGDEIKELNEVGTSGFYQEGVELLDNNHTFLGSFDEFNNEYIIGVNLEYCLGFNKGFTAYYTYPFDYIINNLTAYKSKVFRNETTENYNTFVGLDTVPAELKYVVNPEMDSDKIFKSFFLQSNKAWDAEIKTNYTESFIPKENFEHKESFFFTEIMRNTLGYDHVSGIGNVKSIIGNVLFFSQNIPNDISVGDSIQKDSGSVMIVTNINGNRITVDNPSFVNINDYVFSQKKSSGMYRPDGSPIRGKWMEVNLKLKDSTFTYITGTSTELIKSYL